ncbi:sensor histidine kinase [Clostridium botulinum]|uniref:sensor histidine kinase n=1 Tax=Clostridium botulinum TaxID=1491 RepID=UPI001967A895|nr:HAMP domain-containing sensor histidine kinase [Clostridium botulinum]MBN1065793.1 sensor histidine kinase [Clostridium botulinum]MBN1072157.1 sensor histidine kinase [Clostridium botulinum]
MKISIKVKFSVFLAILLLFTVSILSTLVLSGIRNNQKKDYEKYLAQQVKIANTYIRQMYLTESIEDNEQFLQKSAPELVSKLNSINGMYITIYDINGEELVNSMPYHNRADVKELLSYALKDQIAYQVIGDYAEYMAPLYNEEQIGVIKFHYSLKKNIDFYNDIKALFINIGAIVFIFSFIYSYFYLNTFTKSIFKLKKDTLDIKRGLYNSIVPLKRKDELGELSEGIYYMSSQIEKNIKKMEEEHQKLRLAVQKLKALEKQQKTFIGNITHEFKTPLTVIKAYMDLLDMYSDDFNLLQDAKVNITKETQRLYEMVEKTLHLSSLQKYDFEFQCEKIDVRDILEEICSRMKGKIQKFNITLIKNLKSGFILGDKENLIHIFINLIDNAIKYNTINGEIYVNSYMKDKKVFIEIADTGIGIPKEAREKIFEPFYMVNKDKAKNHGGAGLGLALVKELITKQKGTIYLLDTKEKVTIFLISFPSL